MNVHKKVTFQRNASITGVDFFSCLELDKFPTFVELVGVVDAAIEIDER